MLIYIYIYIYIKVKVKWSRYRPRVARRVGRGIALLFHDRSTRRGWAVSSTPRPHFTPGKDPVPILQEARWAPGSVWTGGKSLAHRDSIPDRPARSSVYYMPLHVSSTICSSSGGQSCIIQHLVSSHSVGGRPVHRLREDCAPDGHLQVWRYQVLYNRILTSWWWTQQSGAQVEIVLSEPVHRTATYRMWRYQVLYNTILTSWWWAQQCPKHVEAYNKLIIKQDFLHSVG